MIRKLLLLLTIIFSTSNFIFAWIYPEHRDIALLAVKNLDSEHKMMLDEIWQLARHGNENRLTFEVIEPYQFRDPKYLDFAAWPAISADHSCSPQELLNIVLTSDWILKVADIAAKLKIDLKKYGSKDARLTLNALRDADILLQRADPEYATRAGSNNVHFLLSLSSIASNENIYSKRCLNEGEELNAIGTYAFFHYSAMQKISKVNSGSLTKEENAKIAISALADEAFALHFLEDVFAAGHVAGTWGNASQRKGTHDYYNEHGLRTATWGGESVILTGDAYMRDEDASRTAEVVKMSIMQFINAYSGRYDFLKANEVNEIDEPNSFNVCQSNYNPKFDFCDEYLNNLEQIVSETPIPGLTSGTGELPRFRAELGLFMGFAPSLHASLISGGFSEVQKTIGFIGGLEASLRFGFGLDGVLNEAGDGLIFLSLGWREDGSSNIGVIDVEGIENYGSIYSAVPARSAFSARLRLPFYLIPGDLLITAPILLFTSPKTFENMAVVAGNGGLIPWHSGIATSIGRFQFVLGREIGVYLYGRTKERDALVFITKEDLGILSYRSTKLEFPFLEFRPTRSFASNQSSTFLMQFYGGVDIPHNVNVLESITAAPVKLQNIYILGMKMTFDWRHYF